MIHQQQIADRMADGAAVVSVTAATTTWLGTANEVAQLVGTFVAILSGAVALAYHLWKWNRELKK